MVGKEQFNVREDVAQLIFRTAQARQLITYGDIYKPLGMSRKIGPVVGNVSEWSYENWQVYLSAICVNAATLYPSGGFFGLPGIKASLRREEENYSIPLSEEDQEYIRICQEQLFAWAAKIKKI